MKKLTFIFCFFIIMITPVLFAQQAPSKKLDLGDIAIKGELLGDDRMNFVRRQREELRNRVKFRTNFRPEILQEYKN